MQEHRVLNVQIWHCRALEMPQGLRTLAALADNPGLVSSNHTVPSSQPPIIVTPGDWTCLANHRDTDTDTDTHTFKSYFFKKFCLFIEEMFANVKHSYVFL